MSDNDEKKLHATWIRDPSQKGKHLFTFDGVEVFNLFRDYPSKLTQEQKQAFDNENPFWAEFFSSKKMDYYD